MLPRSDSGDNVSHKSQDPTQYDCFQNVIYDKKRGDWAKNRDANLSESSPDEDNLQPVLLQELENLEFEEDTRSLLKYSASIVESGNSPQKERHTLLLRQLMTGKISLKFKLDVSSDEFIKRQLEIKQKKLEDIE